MNLNERIFEINSTDEFVQLALEVYDYQKKHCKVYSDFVKSLDWPNPTKLEEIPFLPIDFFKTHDVIVEGSQAETVFKSSGTGGNRSYHLVTDIQLYRKSFEKTYRRLIGNPENQVILALLPNYLEQGESSLVYMVEELIKLSDTLSGFVLGSIEEIKSKYKLALDSKKEVVLIGVTYALLDLAEENIEIPLAKIIETGGMKGRRKELSKEELHNLLKEKFKCEAIYSEYGMTELLSQAYSKGLHFKSSQWMQFLIRDTNDPFSYIENEKTGGINVIDLANLNSCSFIATQDLGRISEIGLEVMGRFDNSDIRGCNLLVQ